MIQSETVLLAKVHRGCTIEIGGWCHFLRDPKDEVRKQTVRPSLVAALEEAGTIIRTDDRSRTDGATWGLPAAPEPKS